MEEPEFKIPIEEPTRLFKQHLELEHNKRIIFSAPFGVGKTFFLDKFFKESEEKENYKVLHLFPVNYSVSSNEDVFELIKFDILFQLLEDEDLVFDTHEFTTFFKSQFFLINNAEKFGEWILKRFGKTGKSLVAYAKALEKLVNEYKKFEAEVGTNSEADEALNFLLEIKEKKGIAYEEDAITKLIQSFLQQLCNDKKKSILIIDDLDRIDPEHIFRLLNVFAAHFDIGEKNTNKFGFDRVIFVCDIRNIRNIFHAKYGSETDFSGYIDKFYSTDVFKFSNVREVVDYVINTSIRNFYKNEISNNQKLNFLREAHNFFKLLELIVSDLIVSDALNLRALKKFHSKTLNLNKYQMNFLFGTQKIYNVHLYLVLVYDILKALVGTYENLYSILEKASRSTSKRMLDTSSSSIGDENLMKIYRSILPILTLDSILEAKQGIIETSYQDESTDTFFHFSFNRNFYSSNQGVEFEIKSVNYRHTYRNDIGSSRKYEINYFELLIEVFRKLRKYGHLKD